MEHQEIISFLTGTAASITAWIITLLITGIASFTYGKRRAYKRIEKNIDSSLYELTQAIENPRGRLYRKEDAARIIELYKIHVSNYGAIKKIVSVEQIETIESLFTSEADDHILGEHMARLKDSWNATVTSMKRSIFFIDQEIGSKISE